MKSRSQILRAPVSILAVLTLTLPACSSDSSSNSFNDPADLPPPSSEGGQLGVYNPQASIDVFACEAPYYLELRGIYLGQVSYAPAGESASTCTWDATLQVRGGYESSADTRNCVVSAAYSYTLLSGDSPCVDGSLEGGLIDPLAASANRVDWETPDWPLDIVMQIDQPAPADARLPVANSSNGTPELSWRFDGLGDTLLIDTVDADGTVSGTLVKR